MKRVTLPESLKSGGHLPPVLSNFYIHCSDILVIQPSISITINKLSCILHLALKFKPFCFGFSLSVCYYVSFVLNEQSSVR